MAPRIGVVLAGCGVMDGSEIHEAVSVLIALDQRKTKIICMAPNVAQTSNINHLTGKPAPGSRNVLEESARIARGQIRDIASVKADELDALIFPGGFGAAKNLCTFAVDGSNCRVDPNVERLLREMHQQKKPIGLACIAPVIAARVFGQMKANPIVTIGTDRSTAAAIAAMGARHQDAEPTAVCVDEPNKLVTTPCYMTAAGPAQVFEGAAKMVEQVLRLIPAKA